MGIYIQGHEDTLKNIEAILNTARVAGGACQITDCPDCKNWRGNGTGKRTEPNNHRWIICK